MSFPSNEIGLCLAHNACLYFASVCPSLKSFIFPLFDNRENNLFFPPPILVFLKVLDVFNSHSFISILLPACWLPSLNSLMVWLLWNTSFSSGIRCVTQWPSSSEAGAFGKNMNPDFSRHWGAVPCMTLTLMDVRILKVSKFVSNYQAFVFVLLSVSCSSYHKKVNCFLLYSGNACQTLVCGNSIARN